MLRASVPNHREPESRVEKNVFTIMRAFSFLPVLTLLFLWIWSNYYYTIIYLFTPFGLFGMGNTLGSLLIAYESYDGGFGIEITNSSSQSGGYHGVSQAFHNKMVNRHLQAGKSVRHSQCHHFSTTTLDSPFDYLYSTVYPKGAKIHMTGHRPIESSWRMPRGIESLPLQ